VETLTFCLNCVGAMWANIPDDEWACPAGDKCPDRDKGPLSKRRSVAQHEPGAPAPSVVPAQFEGRKGTPVEHAGTAPVGRDKRGRITTVSPDVERGAKSIVEALTHRRFMHRDRILKDKPFGDPELELEYAAQMRWVTVDGDQVRLGSVPVPVPNSPPPERAGSKQPVAGPRSASEAILGSPRLAS
jgi:hypothetical protein